MSAVLTPTFAPPTAPPLPIQAVLAGLRRFTVAEYRELIRTGFLTEDDPVELLDGYLVYKMPQNSLHSSCILALIELIPPTLPSGWVFRPQLPIELATSAPEPDGAIVRGVRQDYVVRQPGATETALVIEAAESSLAGDRLDKARLYARANISEYWIINLIDRQVEVYTAPQPAAAPPAYATRRDYRPGDAVPLVLDGATVAALPVADLLP
jgi:Uma2 family endonuclease